MPLISVQDLPSAIKSKSRAVSSGVHRTLGFIQTSVTMVLLVPLDAPVAPRGESAFLTALQAMSFDRVQSPSYFTSRAAIAGRIMMTEKEFVVTLEPQIRRLA